MSTNPFELRFKLLEMAQGYLQDQQAREEQYFTDAWNLAIENGNATMEFWSEIQPESYSIADIKKKAAELYEFVEKRD